MLVFPLSLFVVITHELKMGESLSTHPAYSLHLEFFPNMSALFQEAPSSFIRSPRHIRIATLFATIAGAFEIEDVRPVPWASLRHYLLTTILAEPRAQILRRFGLI